MARARGQVDLLKQEAILDAAMQVLAERGVRAPVEEVARRAGVSKQTIYNQHGSKTELVRTLMERRRNGVGAYLEAAGPEDQVEDTLARYALAILELITGPYAVQLLRMGVISAIDMPELAGIIYDAGPRATRQQLADFLASAPAAQVCIDDPLRAADMFLSMVVMGTQIRLLLGQAAEIDCTQLADRGRECARRFVRAYAPTD